MSDTSLPATLNEALDRIPLSFHRVSCVREGGYRLHACKNMNGGQFIIITDNHPTWQEAYAELWGKL